MTLKLYYDLMSQPSRALYILLKTVKCNFSPQPIDLRKGEHFSDEFTAINRFQRVPVIDNNGFILTERTQVSVEIGIEEGNLNQRHGYAWLRHREAMTLAECHSIYVYHYKFSRIVAILKFLARENIIPETLYPKDIKTQARVDEFLEWQHTGIRLHCAMYFRVKYLDAVLSGKAPNPQTLEGYERRMTTALENFDRLWLGQGHQFIAGDTVTVADLIAACELEQPRMAGFDPSEKYSNIAVWWNKVRQHFSPHYQEAHVILNKIVAKQDKIQSKL